MKRIPVLGRLPEYFAAPEPVATRCLVVLLDEVESGRVVYGSR